MQQQAWWEALADWAAWLRAGGAPETTIGQRRYQVRRFARDHGQVTPWVVTLDQLVDWLASHDWAPNTRRSFRNALRAFYAWAETVGRVEKSPAAGLPRVKPTRGVPRPVAEDVLREALSRADERSRLILLLAAYGGLRRAEIAGLHRDQLTRADDGWTLRVHGKGDAWRTVPLTAALAETIRDCPPGHLFPSPCGGHLTPAHVGVLASRLLPDGWSLHTLRHRFASRVRAHGHDLDVIAELLGHRSIEMTRIYAQLPGGELRRAVDSAA